MRDSNSEYYYRKTAVKALHYLFKNRLNSHTILGVGCSPKRPDLQKHWQNALLKTLRTFKRSHNIEYVLVFEKSKKGFEHAHLMLMQKRGTTFSRLDRFLIDLFRELFFRKLLQLVNGKTKYAYETRNLDQLTDLLDVDRQMVYAAKSKKINGERALPGRGSGFADYLLEKIELKMKGRAVVSKGLLAIKLNKVKLLESRGWKKHE